MLCDIQTSRNVARSLRTCLCISSRPLRRQTHGRGSSESRAQEGDHSFVLNALQPPADLLRPSHHQWCSVFLTKLQIKMPNWCCHYFQVSRAPTAAVQTKCSQASSFSSALLNICATSCLSPDTHNANVHLKTSLLLLLMAIYGQLFHVVERLVGARQGTPFVRDVFDPRHTEECRWRRPAELWCWCYYNNNWWDSPPLGIFQKEKEWGLVTWSEIRAQMMHQLIKQLSSTDEQIFR